MLFGRAKADKEVSKQIVAFCELIGETVVEYRRMIGEYIDWNAEFKRTSKNIHDMETRCDELRRGIQRAMFEGAFLPAYRQDYIVLLEKLDRVANKAEETGDNLYLMRPDIPEEIRPPFVEIADLTVEAFEPIPGAVGRLLDGETDVSELAEFVESREQEVDAQQFRLTHMMFLDLGMDRADALCLKLLLDSICEVSDRIENVTDQMAIIAIKRQL